MNNNSQTAQHGNKRRVIIAILSALLFALLTPLVWSLATSFLDGAFRVFMPSLYKTKDPLGSAVILFTCFGPIVGAIAGFITSWVRPSMAFWRKGLALILGLVVAVALFLLAALLMGGLPSFSLV
jgi:hypothetical protein